MLSSLFLPHVGHGLNLDALSRPPLHRAEPDLPVCGMLFPGEGKCCLSPGLSSLCPTAGADGKSFSATAAITSVPIAVALEKDVHNTTIVVNSEGNFIAMLYSYPNYEVLEVESRNKERSNCLWASVMAVSPTPAPFQLSTECVSVCDKKPAVTCLPFYFCSRMTDKGTMLFAVLSNDARYT